MDAISYNRSISSPRETYADEEYRGYQITYDREYAIFSVAKPGYKRGVSSLRREAKRWIDLLIDEPGFEEKAKAERAKRRARKTRR